MGDRETVPDRLRAVADSAAEQGNGTYGSADEAATAFRVGLAQCVATLRMAAAAWPDEQMRPPRPPAHRGRDRVPDALVELLDVLVRAYDR